MTTRSKFALSYVLMVLVPAAAVLALLRAGTAVFPIERVVDAAHRVSASEPAVGGLRLSVLLSQVIVIIVASRLVGALMRRLGQPQVVGEMLAGILLGPSLLGVVAPAAYSTLFPVGSLRFLNALSQIGLVLFMFLVGLELDPRLLRERGHSAVLTSHASILAPMLLGTALALPLYSRVGPANVPFVSFALFLGAAMSVTAFPVLARILTERGLHRTRLGAVAIACAAVDDVTAWCVLAVVVAIARSGASSIPIWMTVGGAVAFAGAMLGIVRPLLRGAHRLASASHRPFQDFVAAALVVILASAWLTERLGVHALFGAFLAGVAMPKDAKLVRGLTRRFEDLMVTLLLPLFFAYTGLRMSVGLVNGTALWLVCGAVIATAIVGKLGGSALAARASGLDWRESLTVGALMNTRGLMELIILNIGLDLGVITPVLFTMMVMMALTTTLMTTPLVVRWAPASLRSELAPPLEEDIERLPALSAGD